GGESLHGRGNDEDDGVDLRGRKGARGVEQDRGGDRLLIGGEECVLGDGEADRGAPDTGHRHQRLVELTLQGPLVVHLLGEGRGGQALVVEQLVTGWSRLAPD